MVEFQFCPKGIGRFMVRLKKYDFCKALKIWLN